MYDLLWQTGHGFASPRLFTSERSLPTRPNYAYRHPTYTPGDEIASYICRSMDGGTESREYGLATHQRDSRSLSLPAASYYVHVK